jgi:hypothetical protein
MAETSKPESSVYLNDLSGRGSEQLLPAGFWDSYQKSDAFPKNLLVAPYHDFSGKFELAGMREKEKRAHAQMSTTQYDSMWENVWYKFFDDAPLPPVKGSRTRQNPRNYVESPASLPLAYRGSQRRYLPLQINGITTFGLPDTALRGNAMTEEWALHIGAEVKYSPFEHSFVNAKGQSFESIGTTQLVVSIPGSLPHNTPDRKWTCSFAVVKQLAAPLVLGAAFLRKTETLTTFAHLLVKKTLSVVKEHLNGVKASWRFMHMDLRTQKLDCFLDNGEAFVSLDTGSDIDVVSLDYANSRGWEIRPLPEDEAYVLLANDELAKLAGYIETTLMIQGRGIFKKLFVLDGLVCDAVLGDPTIEALNIFDEFKASIIDVIEPEGTDAFRMIQWIEKIDEIQNELERLVLNGEVLPGNCQTQKGWKSIFRGSAAGGSPPADDEGKLSIRFLRDSVLIPGGSGHTKTERHARRIRCLFS